MKPLPKSINCCRRARKPPLVCGTGGELNGRKALRGDYCEPRLSQSSGSSALDRGSRDVVGRVRYESATPHVRWSRTRARRGQSSLEPAIMWIGRTLPPNPGMRNTSTVCYTSAPSNLAGAPSYYVPGSHHFVQKCLEDPELRGRAVAQEFKEMDGLQERKAMCVPAGSAVFFHAFMVHDRSENVLDVPRRVMFAHFVRCEDGESIEDRSSAFHSDQVRFNG